MENNIPFLDIVFIGDGVLFHFGMVAQVGHFDGVGLDLLHGLRNQAKVDLRVA